MYLVFLYNCCVVVVCTVFYKTVSVLIHCFCFLLAANKIIKKLKDCTQLERAKGILEVEMLDKKAPVQWFKNGEPIKPTDR